MRRNALRLERWGAQALEETKSSNLLFWGSRFHLFVSWSADRAHPWDALPAAGHYAMLEIGNHRGTDGQARPHIACPSCLLGWLSVSTTCSSRDIMDEP